MSTQHEINNALHIDVSTVEAPASRLIICVKRVIDGKELDNGHFGLICAHSTGIAFNSWSSSDTQKDVWFPQYPNIIFNEKYTQEKFDLWRWYSFRKLVLQVESDTDFENIKAKLTRDNIPFRICGEVAFGDAEVGIVVFPLTKEETPKYLKFMRVWR